MRVIPATVIWGLAFGSVWPAIAQIDPVKRELIQLGYNQPLQERGPINAYAFYYANIPHYHRTNFTLRLAVAPIYLDSELGISGALGARTDLGLGLSGGGFADSYSEVRGGKYLRGESFSGHGASVSASVYHLFNPGQQIPLNGVLRSEVHHAAYQRDSTTAPGFVVPQDRTSFNLRTGVRWGGREPLMLPEVAMEISAWHEAEFRTGTGAYGVAGNRQVRDISQLFWGRALLTYTFPELKHTFNVSLTAGTSINADRFSAYRLGGVLPLAAEFPLTLPGYYFQEISARQFVLFGANYMVPLDQKRQWALNFIAAAAGVEYVSGLEQPGNWHSGVGTGVTFRSQNGAWQVVLGYAYGIDAIRRNGRGAHSVGFLLQYDLERKKKGLFDPGENPSRSRGLERLLRIFD